MGDFSGRTDLADGYVFAELIEACAIVHEIASRLHVLDEVDPPQLPGGGNVGAEVGITPVDGSLEAVQVDLGGGGKIDIAKPNGGRLHHDVGDPLVEAKPVDV